MILDLIINFAYITLYGFINLLPDTTGLPANIDNSLSYFAPIWNSWDSIFPLSEALVIVGIVILVEAVIFALFSTKLLISFLNR